MWCLGRSAYTLTRGRCYVLSPPKLLLYNKPLWRRRVIRGNTIKPTLSVPANPQSQHWVVDGYISTAEPGIPVYNEHHRAIINYGHVRRLSPSLMAYSRAPFKILANGLSSPEIVLKTY